MHCELLSNLIVLGVLNFYIYFPISLIQFSSWKVELSLYGILQNRWSIYQINE